MFRSHVIAGVWREEGEERKEKEEERSEEREKEEKRRRAKERERRWGGGRVHTRPLKVWV